MTLNPVWRQRVCFLKCIHLSCFQRFCLAFGKCASYEAGRGASWLTAGFRPGHPFSHLWYWPDQIQIAEAVHQKKLCPRFTGRDLHPSIVCAGHCSRHARLQRRGPGKPGQRGRFEGRAGRQAGGGHGRPGARQGQDHHGRRAQVRRHLGQEPQAHGVPRGGPRPGCAVHGGGAPRAQSHHHPQRCSVCIVIYLQFMDRSSLLHISAPPRHMQPFLIVQSQKRTSNMCFCGVRCLLLQSTAQPAAGDCWQQNQHCKPVADWGQSVRILRWYGACKPF